MLPQQNNTKTHEVNEAVWCAAYAASGDGFWTMVLHRLGRYEQANATMKQSLSGSGEGWRSIRYGLVFVDRVFEMEKCFASHASLLI
jgi:hypothetical protein